VVDHIVEHLAAIGVDHAFGVDGANIEDLYDAAYYCSDLTAIFAKHEFSAPVRYWLRSKGGHSSPKCPAPVSTR
jgi:glyoxylate carboligase